MATAPPATPRTDRADRAPRPDGLRPRRVALVGLFLLLLLSLLGRAVFNLWEPAFDGTISYAEVRELGGAYWPMNLYLGGPAYAVCWVSLAVFMVALGRGRSAVLNLVGALLTGLGGILFALVITAEVLPFALAADPAVLAEEDGRALFDVLNAQFHRLVPTIIASTIAIAVGALLVFVAALISRATPRWFAVAGVAHLVVFVGLPVEGTGTSLVVIGYLLQLVLVAGLGWFGLRAGLGPFTHPPTDRPGRERSATPTGDDHDRTRE